MGRGLITSSLVLGAIVTACTTDPSAICSSDTQCILTGTPGICVIPGFCAYPDDACDSGYRYGPHAQSGQESECVAPEHVTSIGGASTEGSASQTGSDGSTASSADAATSSDPTLTSGEATTTGQVTLGPTTDPSTTATVTASTGGTSTTAGSTSSASAEGSSGGPSDAEALCVDLFGSQPGFELCQATDTQCAFGYEPLMTTTCTEVCEGAGQTCITVVDTNPPALCIPLADNNHTCLTTYNHAMCVCTLG